MTSRQIIDQIILKGGIIGQCAGVWRDDKIKSELFLRECADMCRSEMAQDLWGKELISAILANCKEPVKKYRSLKPFDVKVLKTIKDLRISKGILQKTLASALNMSTSNYNKLEKGLRALEIGELDILSKELNVTIEEVLFRSMKFNDQIPA